MTSVTTNATAARLHVRAISDLHGRHHLARSVALRASARALCIGAGAPARLALHFRRGLSFGARRLDHPAIQTYILYDVYITPGLMAMIQLFNGMQSSLSMVYDRETGNMRTLLVSPLPRWYLLTSKLLAGTAFRSFRSMPICSSPISGGSSRRFALGLCDGAAGAAPVGPDARCARHGAVVVINQLENFAGVMNFVIFPMFFAPRALYPIWKVQEGSPWLATVCQLNPFTYAVELIRFALYLQVDWLSLAVVAGCLVVFLGAAILAYDPSRGMLIRRGGAGRMSAAPKQKRSGEGRSVWHLVQDAGDLLGAVRFELRNIGPDVVALAVLFEAREDHLHARNIGLRIGDVFLERIFAPRDAGLLHRVRIIVAGHRAGLAAVEAVQLRADEILRARADLMAKVASVAEKLFAGCGITRSIGGMRQCGHRKQSSRSKDDIVLLHRFLPLVQAPLASGRQFRALPTNVVAPTVAGWQCATQF